MGTAETIAIEDAHLPGFWDKIPVSIERGEGDYVWDEEGVKYLDLTSGWGVTCMGTLTPRSRPLSRSRVRGFCRTRTQA